VTIADKLTTYRMWFEAMPSHQLTRVLCEFLALAPRYLPENPEKAEAHYAAAGLALAELSKRIDC
jgi:hypothetical protein